MNGALTIGTLDGSNSEFASRWSEISFLFGLTVEGSAAKKPVAQSLGLTTTAILTLKLAIRSAIAIGLFLPRRPEISHALWNSLLYHDPFLRAGADNHA